MPVEQQNAAPVGRIFRMQIGVCCCSFAAAALGLGMYYGAVRSKTSAMNDAACTQCSHGCSCPCSDTCGLNDFLLILSDLGLVGIVAVVLLVAPILVCASAPNKPNLSSLCCCNFTLFGFGLLHIFIIFVYLLNWSGVSDDIANATLCNNCANSPGQLANRNKQYNGSSASQMIADDNPCDYSFCIETHDSHKAALPSILVGFVFTLVATIGATASCFLVGCRANQFHRQVMKNVPAAYPPVPGSVVGQPVTIMETVNVAVPAGITPGMPFNIEAHGRTMAVVCPAGVSAGQLIAVNIDAAKA